MARPIMATFQLEPSPPALPAPEKILHSIERPVCSQHKYTRLVITYLALMLRNQESSTPFMLTQISIGFRAIQPLANIDFTNHIRMI